MNEPTGITDTLADLKNRNAPAIDFGPSFNWLTILEELRDGRGISTQDHWTIECRAACWPNCACGQLCKTLPKRSDNGPADEALYMLGLRFADYIALQDWPLALEIFHQIEARTTELLKNVPA